MIFSPEPKVMFLNSFFLSKQYYIAQKVIHLKWYKALINMQIDSKSGDNVEMHSKMETPQKKRL